jgi:hypothetical protein
MYIVTQLYRITDWSLGLFIHHYTLWTTWHVDAAIFTLTISVPTDPYKHWYSCLPVGSLGKKPTHINLPSCTMYITHSRPSIRKQSCHLFAIYTACLTLSFIRSMTKLLQLCKKWPLVSCDLDLVSCWLQLPQISFEKQNHLVMLHSLSCISTHVWHISDHDENIMDATKRAYTVWSVVTVILFQ